MPLKIFLYCSLFLALLSITLSSGNTLVGGPESSADNLVVKGGLVCLNKDFKETNCPGKNNTFGLKTGDGRIYPLRNDKYVATLNSEKRLRTRTFQLTLKRVNNSPFYEIIKSQFIRDGKLYNFFYYCEVCNITTYSPGLCMCCQDETEYREKLAE